MKKNMGLYEILNSQKHDKIETIGVKTTTYYSFETVEKMIALALENGKNKLFIRGKK